MGGNGRNVSRGRQLLVVSDTGNSRFRRYAIAQDGSIKPEIEIKAAYPRHARVNYRGEILLLDGWQRRVLRFSSAGESLGYFDLKNAPDAVAGIPKNIAIDRMRTVFSRISSWIGRLGLRMLRILFGAAVDQIRRGRIP